MKRYTLDVRAAAEILGFRPATVYQIVQRGEIEHLRSSMNQGRIRFAPEDLQAWIDQRRRGGTAREFATATPAPARADVIPMPAVRRFGNR